MRSADIRENQHPTPSHKCPFRYFWLCPLFFQPLNDITDFPASKPVLFLRVRVQRQRFYQIRVVHGPFSQSHPSLSFFRQFYLPCFRSSLCLSFLDPLRILVTFVDPVIDIWWRMVALSWTVMLRKTLGDNADVKEFYLGLTAVGKKSYRDVKHYHRRKRWLA